MEVSFMFVCLCSFVTLLSQLTHSATVVVDGVSEWKNPSVQVGDSIIFEHKYHYNLYIFRNQRAFNLCNFTLSTLLSKPNSTSFTWHPSRPGLFYFSFNNNNGSINPCTQGQKFAVKVSFSPPPQNLSPSPQPPPPPPLSSGGSVSSSPSYPWPFRPKGSTTSPSPAPTAVFPATNPSAAGGGDGIPFINSNPAVPLPTGEVDSATIRPVPTSGHPPGQVVGFIAVERALCLALFLMLL